MSATDELRRMLDERGVEWTYKDGTVRYESNGHWHLAWAYNDDKMVVSMGYLTPEEAIAATLGAGTCRNVSDPPEGFLCSECGWGDFAEPSHLLTGSCYAGLAKGPRYCPNCGRKVEQ